MLDSFKRWINGRPDGPDSKALSAWAAARGHHFKKVREGQGFVVDGSTGGREWRLEWGIPQRSYLEGYELRFRAELGLPQSLQMLLLSRSLAERLESDAFERYTQDMQTQIDHSMPEEMRWLAMFPKVALPAERGLRHNFVLVANAPQPAARWLEGDLARRLEAIAQAGDQLPAFVLMTLRGRVYLRMEAQEVSAPQVLDQLEGLLDAAARGAQAAAADFGDSGHSGPASNAPTAWQSLEREPPAGRARR